MIIADVLTTRPAVEIVRAAVSYPLEALGYRFTSKEANLTISGEVAEFGVTVSESLSTWDSIGFLNVIIQVQPAVEPKSKIIRRYKARHVLKTRSPPTKFALEQVMCKCLEDMQRQMSSDMELTKLLGEITQ